MPADGNDPILNTTVADRYEVYAKLGEGGMGAVYAAKQSPLGRTVALKVLLKQLSSDPIAVKRFEKEALAISRLAHPNTVTIFDFGTTPQGLMYIAMEFLEGRTLGQLIETEAPLAPRRVVRILAQIVRALSEAHQRGVIHRDLKPDNIMLVPTAGEPDFVKVLDFGVAKLRAPEGVDMKTLTQGDVIFGTPRYMSPEQVNGIMDDSRSDLYAVGAIAYEMLCGQPLFDGDSAMTILIAQVQQAPTPFSLLPRPVEVPDELSSLVFQLLSKDRNDRHPDASALLDHLDRLPGVGGGLSGPSGRTQGMLRPVLTPNASPKLGTMAMGSDFVPAKKSDGPPDANTRTMAGGPTAIASDDTRELDRASARADTGFLGPGNSRAARSGNDDAEPAIDPPAHARWLAVGIALCAAIAVMAWVLWPALGVDRAVGSGATEDKVRLELSSIPTGAQLFANGVPIGRSPLVHLATRGGAIELSAKLEHHQSQKRLLGCQTDTAVQFVLVATTDDAGTVAVDTTAATRSRSGHHRRRRDARAKKIDAGTGRAPAVATRRFDAGPTVKPEPDPGEKNPLTGRRTKALKPKPDAGKPVQFRRFDDFKEIE